jgi:hypothetical protein
MVATTLAFRRDMVIKALGLTNAVAGVMLLSRDMKRGELSAIDSGALVSSNDHGFSRLRKGGTFRFRLFVPILATLG